MYFYLGIDNNDFYDTDNHFIRALNFSSRLSILAGENNSGKSRLIKQILCKKNNCIRFYDGRLNSYFDTYFYKIARLIDKRYKSNSYAPSDFEKTLDQIDGVSEKVYFVLKKIDELNINIPSNDLNTLFDYMNSEKAGLSKNICYIPVLRGNENFDTYFPDIKDLMNVSMTIPQYKALDAYLSTANTIYNNKTSMVYNIDSNIIFTGEKMYGEIVDILLGEESKREEFHKFEKFIDEMFYENKGFHINPSKTNNCLMIKIGNDKEYEIHNMGEGIKQLITILYPVFMNKNKNMIFFIEEPEINLHPGFQRKLMEILLNCFPQHNFVITTHSNHIMDIMNYSDSVSLYKFSKKNKNIIIDSMDNSYFMALSELGVNASASLLSNCTIWVEGIGDRIYLKKYIDVIFKNRNMDNKYKEGIHYSFVEYGGVNLVHWNFDIDNDNTSEINVKYLNHNAFLITDNDGSSLRKNKNGSIPEKEKTKRKLETLLGDRFYELKSREIENLIKIEVLEDVLCEDNGVSELTRKKYNGPLWDKKFNQDLISKPSVYLGEFIDSTYQLKKKYADSRGKTIRSKADFANKICKKINNISDMSNQAIELANKVCDFIEMCNS